MPLNFTDLIQVLVDEGLLVASSVTARSHLDKRDALIERSSRESEIKSFLSQYDALMRLAEAVVAGKGFQFGDSPHLAMKRIVAFLDPSISRSELDFVSSERHKSKKQGSTPSPAAAGLLAAWNERLPLLPVAKECLEG